MGPEDGEKYVYVCFKWHHAHTILVLYGDRNFRGGVVVVVVVLRFAQWSQRCERGIGGFYRSE